MTTTTVLKARAPRDLLSYIAYAIGYSPQNSLVMACLRAEGGRVGLVARQDLPAELAGVAGDLAGLLAPLAVRDGAAKVVLAVYRQESLAPQHVATLTAAFAGAGVAVADVFQVDDRRYRCLTCSGPCCPPEGRPVGDLQSSPVTAEMVLRGSALVRDRAALVGDLAPADGRILEEVARATARAESRWGCRGPQLVRRRVEGLQLWTAALARDPGSLSPAQTGRLLAALQDVAVRDAVILAAAPNGQRAARTLVAGSFDAGVARALGTVFGGTGQAASPVAPDVELLAPVDALLRHLVRVSSGRRQAHPLALLAWLAWWRGAGALADQLLDRVLLADPEHRLGRLLRSAVDDCVPPPWVRVRSAGDEGVDAVVPSP